MTAAPKLGPVAPGIANEDHEFLKTTFLFQGVEDDLLSTIREFFEKVTFEKGEPIILENETGDHVYFIKSGAVELVRYIDEVKQVARLVLLKSPSHFSEFSVLTQAAKSGSAFAYEPTEILRIKGETFLLVLRKFPQFAQRLAKYLSDLYLKTNSARSLVEFYHPRHLEPRREVTQIIPVTQWRKAGVIPLALDNNVLRVAMLDPFNLGFYESLKAAQPNLVVNACLITQDDYESLHKRLTLSYPPPNADMGAREPVSEVINDIKALLKVSPLFSHFPEDYLNQLAPHFTPLQLKPGEKVFLHNTPAEYLYLVQSGRVSLHRSLPGVSGFIDAGLVKPGEHFGEIAMLTGTPHHVMAQASRASILYAFKKETFLHMLASAEFCIRLSRTIAAKIQARSSKTGIVYFTSGEPLKTKELAGLLPISVISEHKILPLRLLENEITVGTVSADRESIYPVIGRYLLDYRIKLEMITEADYLRWAREFHTLAAQNAPAGNTQVGSPAAKAAAANTVTILEDIIGKGFHDRASDVHFESGDDLMVVRFRIDGVLKEHSEKYPKNVAKEIVSRIKVMSQMDISNHFTPQDGQLNLKIGDSPILARVSCIPMKNGEKVVLRLIRSKNAIIPYNMLAPDRRLIAILREIVQTSQGLFLITGPTGSGKTTTLYSVLNELNRSDANVITLEDPVEMNIGGINQVEVNEKQGMTFAKALRSVLRQDPDVIMVGEVRDEESAQIVFKAAITGHLVLSTLHTNSSLDVTPRLKEMGVPNGTIAAGLLGVLAQRLVRRVCKSCATTRPIKAHELNFIKKHLALTQYPDKMVEGKGCARCKDSGYYDRIPVYEVWRKTPEIKSLLTSGASYEELRAGVRKDGFVSLMECGIQMALNGLTTIDEVMRCITEI